MRKIKIVSDSSSDLSMLDSVEFASSPMKIITAKREFVDDENLNVDEMANFFNEYKERSQTSCPNPADWLDAFGDADDIICVTITSALSGSYNSACTANELKSLIARHKDLDFLYEKIYEDNAMGKISDERFVKLAAKYEDDQKNISKQIDDLKSAFEEAQAKFANADTFRQALKKYTRIKKLTPNILNELIDRIEVHQAEKTEHGKEQKLMIYYNCIGWIYLPEDASPPTPDIHLQTRKGVTTSYGGLATI